MHKLIQVMVSLLAMMTTKAQSVSVAGSPFPVFTLAYSHTKQNTTVVIRPGETEDKVTVELW